MQRAVVSFTPRFIDFFTDVITHSDALLNCGAHMCPQRCHQLFDHSKMACDRVVKSKCPTGHAQSWKCRMGKPASCHVCENERKAREKKLQEEYARQQKRERERQEHANEMAKVEEEIRILREAAVDGQRSKEMAQSLEQRKRDLGDARRLASLPVEVKVAATTLTNPPTNHDKANTSVQPALEDAAGSTGLQSEAERMPSPSEAEWDRQKCVENASNDAIDSLMKMTGLEEVKVQVLKIKARIETALRQNTNMKEERYGIVL